MFEIIGRQGRTEDFTVTIMTAAGGYVVLQSTDVVRAKIYRQGTTILDLDNVATANGSYCRILTVGDGSSIHATAGLRLDQADLAALEGNYEIEVGVVDNSDSQKFKHVAEGSIEMLPSASGDTGLT